MPYEWILERSYRECTEYPKYTTHQFQLSSGFVTITHPHHPLYQQQVEILRIRRGADPDLIVRLPDGMHGAVAMSWTDYAGIADIPSTEPPPLLALAGLRELVQRVAQRQQQSR